ncbi:MAG TPA: cation transporter, partial [Alphaproteobacteria bacterium]|nr:cation transporter [Alphaproteobacteria bacterium]
DLNKIEKAIKKIKGVEDVHHIHVWCISEHDVSLECHIKGSDLELVHQINDLLAKKFEINHCNIQLENEDCCHKCEL